MVKKILRELKEDIAAASLAFMPDVKPVEVGDKIHLRLPLKLKSKSASSHILIKEPLFMKAELKNNSEVIKAEDSKLIDDLGNNTELKKAVDLLCKHLQEDGELFYSWQANIAVCFQDEIAKNRFLSVHENSNAAARKFLNLLIGDR
jgi:hypothetical protein